MYSVEVWYQLLFFAGLLSGFAVVTGFSVGNQT